MSISLELMPQSHGIPTTYDGLTQSARAKRSQQQSASRRKRLRQYPEDDPMGTPDSKKDFQQGKVMEGISGGGGGGGLPDTPPTFCFSAKGRQLVQVVVSPYKCPTFMLSMAVVLLVVHCTASTATDER